MQSVEFACGLQLRIQSSFSKSKLFFTCISFSSSTMNIDLCNFASKIMPSAYTSKAEIEMGGTVCVTRGKSLNGPAAIHGFIFLRQPFSKMVAGQPYLISDQANIRHETPSCMDYNIMKISD